VRGVVTGPGRCVHFTRSQQRQRSNEYDNDNVRRQRLPFNAADDEALPARARTRLQQTVSTHCCNTSRMNVRYSVSRTTRKSPMNRWRVWLTTFLFSVVIDLELCVAETSPADNDKTFRLARCRVRCLASLKVSSYVASLHHTYFVTLCLNYTDQGANMH